jgi:hypothetical protein
MGMASRPIDGGPYTEIWDRAYEKDAGGITNQTKGLVITFYRNGESFERISSLVGVTFEEIEKIVNE